MSSTLHRLRGLFSKTSAAASLDKALKPTTSKTRKLSPSISSEDGKIRTPVGNESEKANKSNASPKPTITRTPELPPYEKKLEKVVTKFKESSESSQFRLRRHFYRTIVDKLAAAKQFSCIQEILEHQKKYEDIKNEQFTVRLISLYGRSGMFDQAQKLFDEMPELNCERSVVSFNALLSAGVNSKKLDETVELFRELPEKLSIKPNVVSYNVLINAFCDMGSLDSALLVVDEMRKNEIEPDDITLNTLLEALYQNKWSFVAERLWSLMESKNVSPNVRSYNAKLRGLKTEKRIAEAVQLIDEMRLKEVKPDIFSFNAVIKGFVDDGNLEKVKEWYGEITKNDLVPNKATLKMLILCACDNEDLDFASEVCMKAISLRCVIGTGIMQKVVDELAKKLKIEEAKELVTWGSSNGYFHYKLKLPIRVGG